MLDSHFTRIGFLAPHGFIFIPAGPNYYIVWHWRFPALLRAGFFSITGSE